MNNFLVLAFLVSQVLSTPPEVKLSRAILPGGAPTKTLRREVRSKQKSASEPVQEEAAPLPTSLLSLSDEDTVTLPTALLTKLIQRKSGELDRLLGDHLARRAATFPASLVQRDNVPPSGWKPKGDYEGHWVYDDEANRFEYRSDDGAMQGVNDLVDVNPGMGTDKNVIDSVITMPGPKLSMNESSVQNEAKLEDGAYMGTGEWVWNDKKEPTWSKLVSGVPGAIKYYHSKWMNEFSHGKSAYEPDYLRDGSEYFGPFRLDYKTHTVELADWNLDVESSQDLPGRGDISVGPHNYFFDATNSFVGGRNNIVRGNGAVIMGGEDNSADGTTVTVAGGSRNVAKGFGSTVSGGYRNEAIGSHIAVAGGVKNVAKGKYGSIIGGEDNEANGEESSILGGQGNEAMGHFAIAQGGAGNKAVGKFSVVKGGEGGASLQEYGIAQGALPTDRMKADNEKLAELKKAMQLQR